MMLNVTTATLGQEYWVSSLEGNKKVQNYLLSLGLFPGETLELVWKSKINFVLLLKDGRYAIDEALALQIHLIPKEESADEITT
ncbi:MAG: FeoA family protein [Eubacteriales bacterium]